MTYNNELINTDISQYNNHTKRVSVVLIFNQDKILTVSRKDNPNDFGLPGGKVEPGETFIDAAIRETKEETGLDIFCLIPVFARKDGDFSAVCFLAQYIGEVDDTLEAGKVIWTDFATINSGSFGEYNLELENHLRSKNLLP